MGRGQAGEGDGGEWGGLELVVGVFWQFQCRELGVGMFTRVCAREVTFHFRIFPGLSFHAYGKDTYVSIHDFQYMHILRFRILQVATPCAMYSSYTNKNHLQFTYVGMA